MKYLPLFVYLWVYTAAKNDSFSEDSLRSDPYILCMIRMWKVYNIHTTTYRLYESESEVTSEILTTQ